MLYDKKRWEPKVVKPKPVLTGWRLILDKAADYIRDHGWTTRRYENDYGEVCILGALRNVNGYLNSSAEEAVEAELALERHVGNAVAHFNDKRGNTKRKVLATLRKAARKGL